MWTHRRSGQTNQRGDYDHRNPYERDRTRVIHCPAFRRLQRKTQILGTDEGDFHRDGKSYYKGLYGSYSSKEEAQKALDALPADVKKEAGIKNWSNVQSNVGN